MSKRKKFTRKRNSNTNAALGGKHSRFNLPAASEPEPEEKSRDVIMPFAKAKLFALPFGKCKGSTIDQVAATDDGLKYLDWMRGLDLYGNFKIALSVYLNDASIKKELDRILAK